ncbi:hypothetical protein SNEBB_006898 [Seison nebaliae]|nr:hypothetical protein SNEBB_006898 [Seison nebaliae]
MIKWNNLPFVVVILLVSLKILVGEYYDGITDAIVNWDKSPFLLQTTIMPRDRRLWPSLCNGHVGTVVFSDTVFLDGVFNGPRMSNYRARIPSTIGINVTIPGSRNRQYSLNVRHGFFEKIEKSNDGEVIQKIFAHRSRYGILVNEVELKRNGDRTPDIDINNTRINDMMQANLFSKDIRFEKMIRKNIDILNQPSDIIQNLKMKPVWPMVKEYEHHIGVIRELEKNSTGDAGYTKIHVFSTPLVLKLSFPIEKKSVKYHFIMSVGTDEKQAREEYLSAFRSRYGLLVEHANNWETVWDRGIVGLRNENNDVEYIDMMQKIYKSFYALYSSVPIEFAQTSNRLPKFYGTGIGSLSYGGEWKFFGFVKNENKDLNKPFGYSRNDVSMGGHLTYHQEIWVAPALMPFLPELGKTFLGSRLRSLSVAQIFAANNSMRGVRWPVEQAFTGYDMCPSLEYSQQDHVTADVAYLARLYIQLTHDKRWIQDTGYQLARDIADYYNSRLTLSPNQQYYWLNNVFSGTMIDDGILGDNDAFTNAMVKLAFLLPKYFISINEKKPYGAEFIKRTEELDKKSHLLVIPTSSESDQHFEYGGQSSDEKPFKTSNVVLIGFPAQTNMTGLYRRQDIDKYSVVINNRFGGPYFLQYAASTIAYLETHSQSGANPQFDKMNEHFQGPFKVLTEKPFVGESNDCGQINYIPGHGAFIQTIMNGYGGLRYRDFQIDLLEPTMLPTRGLQRWNITGFSYMGNELDIFYESSVVIVHNKRQTKQVNDLYHLNDENSRASLRIKFPNRTEVIFSHGMTIEFPVDYMPGGRFARLWSTLLGGGGYGLIPRRNLNMMGNGPAGSEGSGNSVGSGTFLRLLNGRQYEKRCIAQLYAEVHRKRIQPCQWSFASNFRMSLPLTILIMVSGIIFQRLN